MFNVSALLLDDTLLKCVAIEVVLSSFVAFKTLTFHKVVYRHTWGVVRTLVIVLLQMFSWHWQGISLKIGIYLMKLRRTKQSVPVF